MKRRKESQEHSYCYAMIFVYGDQVSKVIKFEAKEKIGSRNEALERYFILENQEVYLTTGSERLSTRGVTSIRLEGRETEPSSLFDLPEMSDSASLAELPEEENLLEPAGEPNPSFDLAELKVMRTEAGLTQRKLSELTTINSRRISRFERGQAEATVEELRILQSVFDQSLINKSNEREQKEKKGKKLEQTTEVLESPREEVRPVTEDSYQLDDPKDEGVLEEQSPRGVKKFIPVIGAKKNPKKKERKPKQVPRGKRSISNIWRAGLWAGIFILGTSGLMAFGQASAARSLSVKAEAGVAQIQDQLENPVEVEDLRLRVNGYGTNFLHVYMNTDPLDIQQSAARERALAMYFFEPHVVQTSTMYKRNLLHSQLYDLEETEDGYAATYYVQYTVESNERAVESDEKEEDKQKSDDTEESHLFEQLITLRIVEQEGIFALEEMPSFSAAPNEKGLIALVENPLAGEQTMSFDDAEPIEQFMDQFLTNYAQNSLEDMQYLMKEPKSLNGEFVYESSDNEIYEQEDGSYLVKSVVLFELKETDIRHEERMSLKIITRDGKYFVEELTHTFARD